MEAEGLFSKSDANKWSTSLILLQLFVLVLFQYIFSKWYRMYKFFKELNLASPVPLPLVGNYLDVRRLGYAKYDREMIKKYGKIMGYFEGHTPVIICTDVQLIRHILVKDFNTFVNRRTVDGIFKAPFDRFITSLKNEEWKNVRRIVSPTFTTGKLKHMHKNVTSCSENLMTHIEASVNKEEDFDAREVFGYYTLDVISSCCFGIDTDSINNPNMDFLKHLRYMFKNTFSPSLKILFIFMFPSLGVWLTKRGFLDVFSEKSLMYISETTNHIIKRRKANLERRNDFIQNMIDHELVAETEPQSNEPEETCGCSSLRATPSSSSSAIAKTLTNSDIVSQAIVFFFAGYETTALTLTFIAYNLAMHPECQQKVCQEIDRVMENHSEMTYEAIAEMTYLRMVIDETLRLYPPASRIERLAGEDFEFNGLRIAKGQFVVIPLHALHRDEDYYPEPDKFIPERFSETEQRSRPTEAYMPFGAGPRHCVGFRFAINEMKVIIAKILLKFEFVPSEKTPATINLGKTKLTQPSEPLYIKLRSRANK